MTTVPVLHWLGLAAPTDIWLEVMRLVRESGITTPMEIDLQLIGTPDAQFLVSNLLLCLSHCIVAKLSPGVLYEELK
jgi:hypothetical protein